GARLDLDVALIDLRNFLREQRDHEGGMRARQEDLRSLGLGRDLVEIAAHAIAGVEVLPRNAVIASDDAFGLAEVDDHMAVLDALDDAVDDLAHAVLEVIVLARAFGFAHFARNDLLGRLRSNTAELEGRQLLAQFVADFGFDV